MCLCVMSYVCTFDGNSLWSLCRKRFTINVGNENMKLIKLKIVKTLTHVFCTKLAIKLNQKIIFWLYVENILNNT